MNEEITLQLLKIRYFEESLDGLFEKSEIFGTYHRCIGQEATAIGFTHSLDRDNDFVVSNHRNHGHYLAFTGDYRGLLDELKGLETGVSAGRGGSQVIFGKNCKLLIQGQHQTKPLDSYLYLYSICIGCFNVFGDSQ